jgi:hypothetical protein
MIGALKTLQEIKYSFVSLVSVGMALMLHVLHMMLLPIFVGMNTMEMHPNMQHSTADVNVTWLTILFVLLNGMGIVYAGRMLWRIWKHHYEGKHARLCSVISLVSIVAGLYGLIHSI